mmetsp:Transcript_28261/g.34312  ORF Transcript_28261/g.34312 Transcript_28261/m.34312 type:complete len:318 (+) Transcript_28261:2703-3656(+)
MYVSVADLFIRPADCHGGCQDEIFVLVHNELHNKPQQLHGVGGVDEVYSSKSSLPQAQVQHCGDLRCNPNVRRAHPLQQRSWCRRRLHSWICRREVRLIVLTGYVTVRPHVRTDVPQVPFGWYIRLQTPRDLRSSVSSNSAWDLSLTLHTGILFFLLRILSLPVTTGKLSEHLDHRVQPISSEQRVLVTISGDGYRSDSFIFLGRGLCSFCAAGGREVEVYFTGDLLFRDSLNHSIFVGVEPRYRKSLRAHEDSIQYIQLQALVLVWGKEGEKGRALRAGYLFQHSESLKLHGVPKTFSVVTLSQRSIRTGVVNHEQ